VRLLQTLKSILHEIHLHVEAVDFVHAVGEALQLTRDDLKVARIVSWSISGCGRMRTHLGAHFREDASDAAQLLMQATHSALQIGELATVGLQHAGVIRYLRLQTRYRAGPDIVGETVGAIASTMRRMARVAVRLRVRLRLRWVRLRLRLRLRWLLADRSVRHCHVVRSSRGRGTRAVLGLLHHSCPPSSNSD
jgi:hypothetical protein